jgi:uncharacterized membrane protein YebE (DUF533 family)
MRFGPIVGSLLGSLGGGRVGRMLGGNAGGMVGSILGSLLGSQGSSMLGGLFGGNNQGAQGQVQGGRALQGQMPSAQPQQNFQPAPASAGTDLADDRAEALIVAMCNAAKADGKVDEAEMHTILGQLGEIGAEESAFLREQLSSPLDLPGLLARVPRGFEQEVYAVSLLTVAETNGNEEAYLRDLASGLGLSADAVEKMKASVNA